jgi:hypothetical protein
MPDVVESPPSGSRTGGRKYMESNWRNWFDGQWRKFAKGDDFECKCESFQLSVRNAAKKYGYNVSVIIRTNEGSGFVYVGPKIERKTNTDEKEN